jgi:oligosaccharide repeat unit polymerase
VGVTFAAKPPLTEPASSAEPPGVVGTIVRGRSDLYLYATGSYAAFAVWYQERSPRTHGLHVGYPLFRALQRVGLYSGDLPPHIPPFVAVLPGNPMPFGWNGYTLLYYPLLDFGTAGMVLYCLGVGAFCGAAYQAVRVVRRSPPHLLVAAHTTTALVLSIFVNKFNNTAWWYILLLSLAPFVVSRWLERVPTAGRAAPLEAPRA